MTVRGLVVSGLDAPLPASGNVIAAHVSPMIEDLDAESSVVPPQVGGWWMLSGRRGGGAEQCVRLMARVRNPAALPLQRRGMSARPGRPWMPTAYLKTSLSSP